MYTPGGQTELQKDHRTINKACLELPARIEINTHVLYRHNIQKTEVHSGLPASANVTNRSTFLRLQHDVKDEQGRLIKMIQPGNHQFRFSFPLAGDTPESIEGMTGNHIVYDLKATAERGFATKDIVARKHLRIIRTLGPDAMESAVASVG